MNPITLSVTWYRRFFVAIIVAALVYSGLYFTYTAVTEPIITIATFDILAVAGAIGSLLIAIFGLFILKRAPEHPPAALSLVAFVLFAFTTAYSVQQSGGITSPFIAFWAVAVFFSPLFGVYGWLLTIILTGSYTAAAYLNGDLSTSMGIAITLSSVLPLGLGLYIFREHPEQTDATGTNIKHLASQLSEVANKSEIIINAIGDGVIAIDTKGTIQLINPAAQAILGWGKQDALLLNFKSVIRLTDEQNNSITDEQNPIQQVLNTNQEAHANKLIALTKAGQKVSISLTASPIDLAGSGAIIIFRDVTKERAEEREQAEFISTASHEMRTPVASIEGYLGLALNPNTATVDQRAFDFIKKAQESAQHLGRLFQDLLDVSRSEDGRLSSTPKVTDMVPFVQGLVEGLSQKAAEKGLSIVFNPGQSIAQRKLMPVYFVHQDQSHMREIIDNLIENAIKYTPQGQVTVDIAGSEDQVVVSIKDTGLGIPAEDLPHLFQKFYRIDNTDRQEIGGTGLGLYLSRRLAESMNGRIWAESTFKEGSTFFLEIPRISTTTADSLIKEEAARAQTPAPVTNIPVQIAPEVPQTPEVPQPQVQPQPIPQPQLPPQPQQMAVAPQPPQQVQPIQQVQPTQVPPSREQAIRPATTVPRGESLTREQIAERVRQLEALAQQQRNAPPSR